jgi:hypothetical protein
VEALVQHYPVKFKYMIKIIKHILKGYALWFWYLIYKPYRIKIENEAERKLGICEKCEFFESHFRRCRYCGCFMDIKVKSAKKEDCRIGRW